jgi:hypothetical protein
MCTYSPTEAYKKDDPESAARCLDKAIAHYCAKGSFRRAATHKQNLGELFEVELGDNRRAAAAYEEAAGWFESVSDPCPHHFPILLSLVHANKHHLGQRRS